MLGRGARTLSLWALVTLLVVPPVTDFVSWSLWRQNLQRLADHSAEAGARALHRGEAAVPAAKAWLTRHRVILAEPPEIEYPPRDGRYTGHGEAIRVRLTATRAPFFHARLFGASQMRASATAAVVAYRSGDTQALRVE